MDYHPLLFDIWFEVPHRPTHDAGLPGFASTEIPHPENLSRAIRIDVGSVPDDAAPPSGHVDPDQSAGHHPW